MSSTAEVEKGFVGQAVAREVSERDISWILLFYLFSISWEAALQGAYP